jgi:hypothetical protein
MQMPTSETHPGAALNSVREELATILADLAPDKPPATEGKQPKSPELSGNGAPARQTRSNDAEVVRPFKGQAAQVRVEKRLETVDGLTLFNADYPVPVGVIDRLLFKGVTLLAGRPKVGKSWLALQLALAVGRCEDFMAHFAVNNPGRVLYFALEEPRSRTSNRIKTLVSTPEVTLQNIQFVYRGQLKSLTKGGAEQLDALLTTHPAELVVIDTLLAVVQAGAKRDLLRSDYAEIGLLSGLAEKHETAILLVCHLRKMAADYDLDGVAGTTGLTAGCDAVWTLKRLTSGEFILGVTGREMEEQTYALRLNNQPGSFGWRILGDGAEVKLTPERAKVLSFLRDEGPHTPAQIADKLEKKRPTVRRLVQKLAAEGLIVKGPDQRYRPATLACVNSVNNVNADPNEGVHDDA